LVSGWLADIGGRWGMLAHMCGRNDGGWGMQGSSRRSCRVKVFRASLALLVTARLRWFWGLRALTGLVADGLVRRWCCTLVARRRSLTTCGSQGGHECLGRS